jgi:hypothetical protein
MTVYTSQGQLKQFGSRVTDPVFDFQCNNGEEIISFEGRSGDYIYALSAIARTR